MEAASFLSLRPHVPNNLPKYFWITACRCVLIAFHLHARAHLLSYQQLSITLPYFVLSSIVMTNVGSASSYSLVIFFCVILSSSFQMFLNSSCFSNSSALPFPLFLSVATNTRNPFPLYFVFRCFLYLSFSFLAFVRIYIYICFEIAHFSYPVFPLSLLCAEFLSMHEFPLICIDGRKRCG